MSTYNFNRRVSIGQKILITSISLIIIGILLTGGLISSIYSSRQITSTTAYVDALVEQISINISTRSREYEDTIFSMVQDWNLFGSYLNKRDSEIYYNRQALSGFVNQRNTSRSPIRNLYCINKEGNLFYFDYENQKYKGENAEIVDYIRTNKEMLHKGAVWMCFLSDPDNVYMMRSIYSPTKLEEEGVIAVGIEKGIFEKMFLSLEYSQSGKVLITNASGQVLLGNMEDLPELSHLIALSDEQQKTQPLIKDGKERYLLRKYQTGDKKWNVVYLIEEENLFGPTREMQIAILLVCAATIAAAVFCASGISRSITKGIRQLFAHIQRLKNGEWETLSVPYSNDEIGEITIAFNNMALHLKDLIEKISQQKLETERAEYKALQSEYYALQARINPHFIFNAMESLNAAAKLGGQEKISFICTALGKLMRTAINRQKSTISLAEELNYIRNYLEIQHFMMGDALEIIFDLEPKADCCMVPSLLLQPLVENAVIHGVENLSEGAVIYISTDIICKDDVDVLLIQISDNGVGMDEQTLKKYSDFSLSVDEDSSNHFGIISVEKRIKILYGENFGVTINSSVGKGTVAKINLPYLPRERQCQ